MTREQYEDANESDKAVAVIGYYSLEMVCKWSTYRFQVFSHSAVENEFERKILLGFVEWSFNNVSGYRRIIARRDIERGTPVEARSLDEAHAIFTEIIELFDYEFNEWTKVA